MTYAAAIFALLATSALSPVSAKKADKRTLCLLDWDCQGLIPDIWSLMTCSSGQCVKSCKSGCASTGSGCAPTTSVQSCPAGQGWNPITKSCINIWTDVNNCGGFQNSCGTDFLASNIFCSSGTCQKTCQSQCSLISGSCQPSVPSACGISGKACPAPLSNGVATCSAGICGMSCNSGYSLSGNDCVIPNTANSCGLLGIKCPTYPGTTATCTLGICGVTCNSGVWNPLTLSCTSSANTCGLWPFQQTCPSVANGKTFCNGLTCGVSCNGGYVSSTEASGLLGLSSGIISGLLGGGSSSLGCIPATTNNNFCGSSGKTCTTSLPNCVATCNCGTCTITGASGYDYDSSSNSCKPISTPIDCGRCGNKCYAPANGTPKCVQSGSSYTCSFTCNNGYYQSGNACIPNGTSAHARLARRSKVAPTAGFCPEGEEACPISGSASLKQALIGAASGTGFLQFAAPTGGYECLDTQTSLESCGGCATTGAGRDCTAISKAKTMGCDAGQCVVFECAHGYRPNDMMDGCEKLPAKGHKPFSMSHKSSNSRSHANAFHHKYSL